MYKGHRIIIFLVIFVCIVLIPVLANIGNTSTPPTVVLDTPEIRALAEKEGVARCVESNEYMRAEHMHLLDSWRYEVVRNGNTLYTSSRGTVFEMSLEEGCLTCHTNRAEFCDSCHTYAAVAPECWSCHRENSDRRIS